MTIVVSMDERLRVRDCCVRCGRVLQIGDFPFCGGEPEDHGAVIAGRGADVTWPGGKTFENLGPEPLTFYSPAEQQRYMKAHRIEPFVRHQPVPGSDRSPHTSDWSKGSIDAQTLENARALLDRSSRGKDAEPQTWVEQWVPASEVGVTRVRGSL